METLLNRYRNITVLLLVIFAQLVLLAYQVKNDSDVRLIRVWAVTAVMPLARTIEGLRGGTDGFLQNYILLRDTHNENQQLRTELGRLKLENQFLKTELSTADRVKALAAFEERTPSKMIAARVIATPTGASGSAVFVDRGSVAGVEKGMAVVTPDGIVGKVLAAYPTASQVLLATDPSFAAGVISQKNRVRGILKGLGHGTCKVEYVQSEEKVETGEWFYTSGDDRVFPKGMPAGKVTSVRAGNAFQQDITLDPTGMSGGLEEVLIILHGVHQDLPELKNSAAPVYLGQPPPGPAQAPADAMEGSANKTPVLATDADRLREHYEAVGAAQSHKFGEGPPGSKPPDFNLPIKPADNLGTTDPSHPATPVSPASAAEKPPTSIPASPRPRVPAAQLLPPTNTPAQPQRPPQ